MDEEVARMIAQTAKRAQVELGHLAAIIKDHTDGETYKEFSLALGRAIYGITEELVDRVYIKLPKIKEEMENRHSKYGRSYY